MPNREHQDHFLLELVTLYPQELNYYTHPGVQVTAHQVGTPHQASWTKKLIELGTIDAVPGQEKYIELERTLSALYCFQLCIDRRYEDFVEAQPNNDKLSRLYFNELCDLVNGVAGEYDFRFNGDNRAVVMSLILKSDLGKSPAVRELAKGKGIDPRLDTDELMSEILKLSPDEIQSILPSYNNLSDDAKSMLAKAYPMMMTCFGHLYFLEAGEKTLENMQTALLKIPMISEREHLLKLVSLAQFFDAIGAQGQLNMLGSVTCTDNFYRGYRLVLKTFEKLEIAMRPATFANAIGTIFIDYVLERGNWLSLYPPHFEDKADYDVVVRLACTLRIFDSSNALKLKRAYYKLPDDYRMLLKTQLSFDKQSGINRFALSPHYVASSAQNISRAAFEQNAIDVAIHKALHAEVCFAMLIKELIDKYLLAASHPKYPLSFAKLAAFGNDNPATLDPTIARWALPRPVPTSKIKNLIFDLGHVFIKIDITRGPVYTAFGDLAHREGLTTSPAEMQRLITSPTLEALILNHHLGQVETTDFRAIMKAQLGLPMISDADFDTAWCASILDHPAAVKNRLEVLKQLIEEGYNIYLLSNNNEIHRMHTKQHFEGLHWGVYFFRQYYSNETHLYKPQHAAFQQVLTDNRLNADETLFLDDVKTYVNAAWKAGIRGRQFTVDFGMNNIKHMINAVSKAESWSKGDKRLVNRATTLQFFALEKLLPQHKRVGFQTIEEDKPEPVIFRR